MNGGNNNSRAKDDWQVYSSTRTYSIRHFLPFLLSYGARNMLSGNEE